MFSEDQGRAIVTCAPADYAAVVELALAHGVPATVLGATGGDILDIGGARVPLDHLRAAHEGHQP